MGEQEKCYLRVNAIPITTFFLPWIIFCTRWNVELIWTLAVNDAIHSWFDRCTCNVNMKIGWYCNYFWKKANIIFCFVYLYYTVYIEYLINHILCFLFFQLHLYHTGILSSHLPVVALRRVKIKVTRFGYPGIVKKGTKSEICVPKVFVFSSSLFYFEFYCYAHKYLICACQ